MVANKRRILIALVCIFQHCSRCYGRIANVRAFAGNQLGDANDYECSDNGSSSETELHETNQTSECPRRCVCTRNSKTRELSVNCDHGKLKHVPDIPTSANSVSLSDNLLTIIRTNQFSNLTDLTDLDISKNKIRMLEKDAFTGLSNLRFVSLRLNNLMYPNSVPLHIFKPLKGLTSLLIDNNCDNEEKCRALVREITTVITLEELFLDGYPGMTFNQSFRNLTHLTYVSFGWNDGHCDMDYITNDTFVGLYNSPLERLTMDQCNIKHVQPGSLSRLVHLRGLYLSENYELCHEGWRNITTGLNFTAIEVLALDKNCVNLLHDTHEVSESDLNPLSTTKLLSLDLHHCRLQVIEPAVISRALPKSLQRLILHSNDLNNAVFLFFLPWLPNLEYLDISSQSRFTSAEGLINVTLDTSLKHIEYPKETDCKPLIDTLPLPMRLKVLNASNLNIAYSVPRITFITNNTLEVLDGSNCFLSLICGKISGLHHLKHLNFSRNRIEFIGYDTFSDMPMLEELNLSVNPLGDMLDNDNSVVLFENLTRLTSLDLSSAGIKKLPVMIFSKLKSLRILKLRANALETIQFRMVAFLQTLELLDVSNNSIKYLPEIITSDLDRIAKLSIFLLALSHNKLECNCQYQAFTKWIVTTKIRILNRNRITCTAQNTSSIEVANLEQVQGQMEYDCVTWIVLTSCVSFFLCFVTFLGLVTALYRQRWKLRYLYYASLKRANPYLIIGDQSEDEGDVYLSFDEDHTLMDGSQLYQMISVKVVNALAQQGINAKIREDLCVGKSLNSEISSVIQQSRKVVVFLSRDYCKEFWNTFEFNMAAYDGMYTNRKVIVPVLVEEFGSFDLLPEVKAYLRKEVVLSLSVEHFDEFMEQLCNELSK